MKAALYLRVSTDEQSTENQLPELRQLATARGYSDVEVYSETVSGAARRRPELERLLEDARAGRVKAVFVWALDRLTRRGLGELHQLLDELARLNVRLVSARDTWLDVAGPVRQLLVSIFGWVAAFERERLAERTRAGLARAKRSGKRLGRPPASPILVGAALDLVTGGSSIRAAAKAKGIPEATLRRALAARRKREGGGEGGTTPPLPPRV